MENEFRTITGERKGLKERHNGNIEEKYMSGCGESKDIRLWKTESGSLRPTWPGSRCFPGAQASWTCLTGLLECSWHSSMRGSIVKHRNEANTDSLFQRSRQEQQTQMGDALVSYAEEAPTEPWCVILYMASYAALSVGLVESWRLSSPYIAWHYFHSTNAQGRGRERERERE